MATSEILTSYTNMHYMLDDRNKPSLTLIAYIRSPFTSCESESDIAVLTGSLWSNASDFQIRNENSSMTLKYFQPIYFTSKSGFMLSRAYNQFTHFQLTVLCNALYSGTFMSR